MQLVGGTGTAKYFFTWLTYPAESSPIGVQPATNGPREKGLLYLYDFLLYPLPHSQHFGDHELEAVIAVLVEWGGPLCQDTIF